MHTVSLAAGLKMPTVANISGEQNREYREQGLLSTGAAHSQGSRKGSLVNRVKDTNKIQKNITLLMMSKSWHLLYRTQG